MRDLPKIRGEGLSAIEAAMRFEEFGAALSATEDVRESAKIRMQMRAEIFGLSRFLSARHWKLAWIAYGP